jgi:hypothetical protein
MKALPTLTAAAALAVAVTSTAGCGGSKPAPTTSKPATSVATSRATASTAAPATPSDYTGLLIKTSDINAPETFTATPPINNPNDQLGATTTFSNPDRTHVIVDTIQILPDPAAATAALTAAKGSTDGYVHGVPEPIAVGTGGTTISGPSPDGAKGVTVLMFTEGKAFVELEFDGPPNSLVPPDFVTDVGQKQDAALKKGLPG